MAYSKGKVGEGEGEGRMGGGGFFKVQILEAKYETKLEFLWGRMGAKQKISMGGVYNKIFFATAHYAKCT